MNEKIYGKKTMIHFNTPISLASEQYTVEVVNKAMADTVGKFWYVDSEESRHGMEHTMNLTKFFDDWVNLINGKPVEQPKIETKLINIRSTRRGAEANLVIGDLHLKLCARSLRVLKRKIKPMLGRSLRPVNIDHAFDQVNGKATFDFNFDLLD